MKKIIVIGGLNTDIFGLGVPGIAGVGELVYGGNLKIGPGGKSRNIAGMLAEFDKNLDISMIGITAKDAFGLWKPPVDSLVALGVDISAVEIIENSTKMPAIALIPVSTQGENQIYVLPGINEDFSPEYVDKNEALFGEADSLVLTLEMPKNTILHSMKMAKKNDLTVFLDPGGISDKSQIIDVLSEGIDFFKPNEHETKVITGISPDGFEDAKKAVSIFHKMGAKNILITRGKNSSIFSDGNSIHQISNPEFNLGDEFDSTGCGDQVMAGVVYFSREFGFYEASKKSTILGFMQFHRKGISPVKYSEYKKITH